MGRNLILGLAVALVAGAVVGCSEEVPTSLGGDLIGEGFRTFEVVLEPEEFLQADTTFGGLGRLNQVPFGLIAESYEGELFAHTLFRIIRPTQVVYESDGATINDDEFRVVGGTVTVVLDSLGPEDRASELRVYEVTESWNLPTVDWETRYDTSGVSAAWMEPGGTTGRLMGQATLAGGDTLEIPLDSAAAAVWADSAAALRGGIIRSATDGTRHRIQALKFAFDVRPATTPDTVVTAGSAGSVVAIATPDPSDPEASELRVGGVPVWRSALQFRPLSEVVVPCSLDSTDCTLPLSEVEISFGALLLKPMAVEARRIERPFRAEVRSLFRAPDVPINRSPLSTTLGIMVEAVEPEAFTVDGPDEWAVLPLTRYLRQNLDPVGDEQPVLWVALLAASEQSAPVFGYASFGSLQSVSPPRLKLVVTVPAMEDVQL